MRIPDYLSWIRQDVRSSPLFAFLNLVGVAATVCAVLVFLALTAGVRQLVVDRLTREVDLLTLEVVLENRGSKVSADSVARLARSVGAWNAVPVYATYVKVFDAGRTREVLAFAESYALGPLGRGDPRLANTPLLAGRYPTPEDTGGVWVSETLFSTLFADTVRVDQFDRVGSLYLAISEESRVESGRMEAVPVQIRGVLKRTPHDGIVVYAPEPLVAGIKRVKEGTRLSAAPAADRVDLVVGSLQELGRAREAMRGEGIFTRSVLDRVESVDKLLLVVRVVFFVVFAVAIMIALFNLVITLITYVLRRRKEVGVLGALGATRGQVQGIFILHALLLGAAGALAGTGACLLVITAARVVFERVDSLRTVSGLFLLSPLHVTGVAAAAVVLSLLASIPPARIAAAITPIDTLRSD